jgi:hypothetical protein
MNIALRNHRRAAGPPMTPPVRSDASHALNRRVHHIHASFCRINSHLARSTTEMRPSALADENLACSRLAVDNNKVGCAIGLWFNHSFV